MDSTSYLWDKVISTYIAHSPQGYRPPTAEELRMRGEEPPAVSGRTTASSAPPSGLMDYPRERSRSEDAPAAASPEQQGSSAERLRELQRLRDEGLITAEQYEKRRASIMEEL